MTKRFLLTPSIPPALDALKNVKSRALPAILQPIGDEPEDKCQHIEEVK